MTDDKQKALDSLRHTSQTCTAAIAVLAATHDPPSSSSSSSTSDLAAITQDLGSLLALVYDLATKLTLALKPPSPAYSASLPLLHDLAVHASGLAHGVSLLSPSVHGATLVRDAATTARTVLEALRTLLDTLACSDDVSGESILRTGMLHDLISSAQCEDGMVVPRDNREAVRRRWVGDKDALEDGLAEVAKMLEQPEPGECMDEEASIADEDGGWGELGLGGVGRLSSEEVLRAKCVHHLLRMTVILHKRILSDVLSSTSPVSVANSVLDALLARSNALVAASDELVADAYPPQEPVFICRETEALVKVVADLRVHLSALFDGQQANKRWFDTCFDQITKLS